MSAAPSGNREAGDEEEALQMNLLRMLGITISQLTIPSLNVSRISDIGFALNSAASACDEFFQRKRRRVEEGNGVASASAGRGARGSSAAAAVSQQGSRAVPSRGLGAFVLRMR